MVSITAAGFGGSIDINEIFTITKMLLLAFVVSQIWFAPPDTNVFDVFQNSIVGYPTCQSLFCLAPSEASLQSVTNSFSIIASSWSDPFALFNLLFSSLDVLKGMIGLSVLITVGAQTIFWLYNYNDKAGLNKHQYTNQ